jgi:hypothetical protein
MLTLGMNFPPEVIAAQQAAQDATERMAALDPLTNPQFAAIWRILYTTLVDEWDPDTTLANRLDVATRKIIIGLNLD